MSHDTPDTPPAGGETPTGEQPPPQPSTGEELGHPDPEVLRASAMRDIHDGKSATTFARAAALAQLAMAHDVAAIRQRLERNGLPSPTRAPVRGDTPRETTEQTRARNLRRVERRR